MEISKCYKSGSCVGFVVVRSWFSSTPLEPDLAMPPCEWIQAYLKICCVFLGWSSSNSIPSATSHPLRWLYFKKWKIISVDEDVEK